MISLSIFTGLIGLGVYGTHMLPVGPRIGFLAWPALFLSLGWAFLEAALAAPGGVAWGYLVCAVLFGLMGGLPLLALFTRDHFKGTFWGSRLSPGARVVPDDASAAPGPGPGRVRWTTSVEPPGPGRGATGATASSADARAVLDGAENDVVSGLERLARLRNAGHLDDAEYQAAKARLLNGGR
jgi:hypothetical protein